MKTIPMKQVFFISCALACSCLSSSGQTNSRPEACGLFSLSAVQLRSLISEPEQIVHAPAAGSNEGAHLHKPISESDQILSAISSVPNPNGMSEPMSLHANERDLDLRLYYRLERGGYLTRAEPKLESRFIRAIDAIFEPEVVRIGKTSVSCSIITAIKRKNPLCLISPIFLSVSW
jgi:hypothetical protein